MLRAPWYRILVVRLLGSGGLGCLDFQRPYIQDLVLISRMVRTIRDFLDIRSTSNIRWGWGYTEHPKSKSWVNG